MLHVSVALEAVVLDLKISTRLALITLRRMVPTHLDDIFIRFEIKRRITKTI